MATLDEIEAKDTSTLTANERDKIREILEFDATPGTSLYVDSEAKFDALDGPRNQRARAYIDDWDDISVAIVSIQGGSDAVHYSSTQHELQVRNRIRLLLGYLPLSDGAGGGLHRIPVGWGECFDHTVANLDYLDEEY